MENLHSGRFSCNCRLYWVGSSALMIYEKVLKIAMLVVLPVILFYVLRSKALKEKPENEIEVITEC